MQELLVVDAGLVPYQRACELQRELREARIAGAIADVLILCEHPPVYTKGRRTTPDELPMGDDWYRMQGIEVCDTDRGGRVTYHGPGQLVAYPIMRLDGIGVRDYVCRMERAMIDALADLGVNARTIEGLTGVWVGDEPPPAGDARKIGSIGIHVSHEVTTHGLAINVANDLQPFEWVVPCGIEACRMTSLTRELGAEQPLEGLATALVARLAEAYGREPAPVALEDVTGRLTLGAR